MDLLRQVAMGQEQRGGALSEIPDAHKETPLCHVLLKNSAGYESM
jgi:hypothetical protein